MASHVSNISLALAGSTGVSNVSSERSTALKDVLPTVAAKGSRAINVLPTPPNSISPNLPPQWRARPSNEVPTDSPTISMIDSDVDLHDAVAISLGQAALNVPGSNDDHGSFTPQYLCKFLTEILQEKGALSISHVMNRLTQVVPGFIDVPPAKARRLTTAALESRKRGAIEFEKVGWGKYANRGRTQTPLSQVSPRLDPIQEGKRQTSSKTEAISIPGAHARRPVVRRTSQGSWTAPTRRVSTTDKAEHDMPEHDAADLMSIDGDVSKMQIRSRQGSAALPGPLDYSDTDEEDWASMGAAALRHGSLSSAGGRSFKSNMLMTTTTQERPRRPSFTPYGRSMPGPRSLGRSISSKKNSPAPPSAGPKLDFTGVEADEKEQAAITALMRMGSFQG